jgi:antitoxin (DNA-binding transcriptional repressor) of toxin-antitoxin stability system
VLRRVEAGEGITIAVRGKPVAQVVPIGPERGLIDTSAGIAREAGRLLRRELLPRQSAVSVITWRRWGAG